MALTNLFKTLKQPKGLATQIDQFLILEGQKEADTDRKNVTNSPSSSLGCCRANYYQRSGVEREPIEPRVRRIFDNGHGMHERIQGYCKRMGVLLMDEVPLVNDEYEIQGHTDGFLNLKKQDTPKEIEILEIKSINSRQFAALKDAKEEHKAQAHTYMFCTEEHRKYLRETYPTMEDFKKSKLKRRMRYAKKYQHLKDGSKYSRAQKIQFKVKQHMMMDDILYNVTKPINTAILLYENKDTQEMKDFVVKYDDAIIGEVLEKFAISNHHWKIKKVPPRECKAKSDGRFCDFVNHCFE